MKLLKRIISMVMICVAVLPLGCPCTAFEPVDYVITASMLNVRSEPDGSSLIIGVLHMDDRVTVIEVSGTWGRITYDQKDGWISLKYAIPVSSKNYTLSENGLAFLKGLEGYSQYKYKDYTQWSIGYGTACGEDDYPDGITEEEASVLLLEVLKTYENYLDQFLFVNNISITQGQYDALVSFTYNLGSIWTKYDSFYLKDMLIDGISNYSEQNVRDAFAQFVRAGDEVSEGLVIRREKEADLFLSDSVLNNKFTDVELRSWYAEGVIYCFKHGYISGMTDISFAPDDTLTRAQFVTMLANVSGADLGEYTDQVSGFADVSSSQWFHDAITWAAAKGYVSGVGNGMFLPDRAVTRQELVKMFYSYAEDNGVDVSVRDNLDSFEDRTEIAEWAYDKMQWAVARGLVSGTSATAVSPEGSATRAQTARIFMLYDSLILGK